MAEFIAVIGTIGAVCNIVDAINKTISLIGDVRSRWKTADLTLLSLASQLTALRAALTEIQKWLELNTEDMHHQLTMDLDVSLSCCRLLASELEAHFSRLNTITDNPLSITGKMRVVVGGQSADDIQKFIEHQTSSLTLLLTACNCTTLSEQKQLLEKPKVRKALSRTKADSVSLLVHRDNASFASKWTDNLSKLSYIFDFDTEVLSSKVYERIFRSSLKQLVRQRPSAAQTEAMPSQAKPMTWFPYHKHAFLLIGTICRDTQVILRESLYRAVSGHPIDVHSFDEIPGPGEVRTNSPTIIYMVNVGNDTKYGLERFKAIEQLKPSSKLHLVLFFSHGLADTRSYEPGQQSSVDISIELFQNAVDIPSRHFDLLHVNSEELDQFTDKMVRDFLAPEEGQAGLVE